ncbi:T-complex protein 1 subunit beta-like protein [Emericellopsis cladophorae]|uniref:CCT-beta n=1 Tax=Emericellopsis cladophorae TaxID=2686198 RepID=A0A9P9Y350_9HYPO|nr:T-complex protein 1 subunit beta-like protein [Emericellopsis cladophorae]KAI6782622.1 T-complex protein 1 subunit beta-like protein [Emericellopsis cladophorae]
MSFQPTQIFEEGTTEEKGENARLAAFVGAIAVGDLVKSTLGPKGMDKILQSASTGEMMVTNDGATILKSIALDNAAAKVLVNISKVQDDEVGDGTTSVAVLAAELLREAEKLVDKKVHPQTIIEGYRIASQAALKALEGTAVDHSKSPEAFRKDLLSIARTTLSSKVLSQDREHFARLACDAVLRLKQSSDLSHIQIIKKAGGKLSDSYLDEGFILDKKIGVNQPKRLEKAKILVANTSMDTDKVKIFGARVKVGSTNKLAELEKAEKEKMKAKVEKIKAHGINCFINRQLIYNWPEQLFTDAGIMSIEHADFDGIERLALVTGGEIASTFDHPDQVKLGQCDTIEEVIIGEDTLIKFSGVAAGEACTIVLRGATDQLLDEAERSLHDALAVLSQTVLEPRTTLGGGCAEMVMAKAVEGAATRVEGKRQLAVSSFAIALRQLPTILADNAGLDSGDLVARLRKAIYDGLTTYGLDLTTPGGGITDMRDLGVIESYKLKRAVVSSASEAAELLLRVDDIIRAAPRARERAATVDSICLPDGNSQSDSNEYSSGSPGDVSDSSDQSKDVDGAITAQLESESQQFVQPAESSTLPNHVSFDIGFKAIDQITTKTTLHTSSPLKAPLTGFHPCNKRLTPLTPPRQTMNRSPDRIRSSPYDIECTSDSDMDSGPIPLNFLDLPKRDGFKTPILTKSEERRYARMADSRQDSPMARKSWGRLLQAQPPLHSEARNSSKPISGKLDRLVIPDPTPDRPAQGEGTALHGPQQQDGQRPSSSSDESNGSPVWKTGSRPTLPVSARSSVSGDRMAVRYSPYPKSRLRDFFRSSLRASRAVSSGNRAAPLTSDTGSLDTAKTEPHTTKSDAHTDTDTRRHNQHENTAVSDCARSGKDDLIFPRISSAESLSGSTSCVLAVGEKSGRVADVPIIPEYVGHEPSAVEPLLEVQLERKTMNSSRTDAAEDSSAEKRFVHTMPTVYTLQPSYDQCESWPMDKPGPYLPHHRDTLTNLRSILKGSELWKKRKSLLASEQTATHQLDENKDALDRIPKRRRHAHRGCRERALRKDMST